jgi:hypothetical protein
MPRSNSNQVKSRILGMTYGKAQHRLRKSIMFMLAQRCSMDICHQCGKRIDTESEISIEHIVAWEKSNDPLKSFSDLDNIAFSHLVCNIKAASKPNKRFSSKTEQQRAFSRARNANPVTREMKNEWRRRDRATKKLNDPVVQQERTSAS